MNFNGDRPPALKVKFLCHYCLHESSKMCKNVIMKRFNFILIFFVRDSQTCGPNKDISSKFSSYASSKTSHSRVTLTRDPHLRLDVGDKESMYRLFCAEIFLIGL